MADSKIQSKKEMELGMKFLLNLKKLQSLEISFLG